MGKVINICGPSYSGTTMLELMLGNAPDAICCGEAAFWFRPVRIDHTRLRCSCGAAACEIWERLRTLPEREFHAAACRTPGVRFVTDSSKTLTWVVDANRWALASHHEVVNLVLWKTPLAFLYSNWKRGVNLQVAWRRYRRYYAQWLQLGLPFAAVNYHRLSLFPAEELEHICRVAGVEYFFGKEQFWKRVQHQLFGNLGTRAQIGRESNEIRDDVDFPADFLRHVEPLQRDLDGPVFQSLAARLENCDVRRIQPEQARVAAIRRIQPAWYYRHRLQDELRRTFRHYRPVPAASSGE
jgi:hypothetical protein